MFKYSVSLKDISTFLTFLLHTKVVTKLITIQLLPNTLQCVHHRQFMTVFFFLVLVYNACGLASYDLFDEIDFDQWFANQLLQELNNSSSRFVFTTYCKQSVK